MWKEPHLAVMVVSRMVPKIPPALVEGAAAIPLILTLTHVLEVSCKLETTAVAPMPKAVTSICPFLKFLSRRVVSLEHNQGFCLIQNVMCLHLCGDADVEGTLFFVRMSKINTYSNTDIII